MRKLKYKNLLVGSMISFSISSMSFLLIPVSNFNGTKIQRILAYMVGILFWTGFITGLTITFLLGKRCKKEGYKKYRFPGLLCFFKNKRGKICDIAMLLSFMLFIIAKILFESYNLIWIVMLSITTFFIFMHSILNGNNYLYVSERG